MTSGEAIGDGHSQRKFGKARAKVVRHFWQFEESHCRNPRARYAAVLFISAASAAVGRDIPIVILSSFGDLISRLPTLSDVARGPTMRMPSPRRMVENHRNRRQFRAMF
jgi:hypothetical protein